MRPIPYGRQQISEEDIDSVVSVLRSDYLTQGPKTIEFEKAFSEYVNVKYAVAVSNGTAALHLSSLALGLKPGDKVITTPITFAASANCVLYSGGEIEFVDINKDNWLIDLNQVEDILRKDKSRKIKGIIPVDFAGLPVNLQELKTLTDQYGLWILEDACHAPGAYSIDSSGKKSYSGSCEYSDAAIFSFHPVKHIATGEGGMATFSNESLCNKVAKLRTHGITKNPEELFDKSKPIWYHEMQDLGYNYRISDIQAALGISQLTKAEENIQTRNSLAVKYQSQLKDYPLEFQFVDKNQYHAYHLMVVLTEKRDKLFSFLRDRNIYCQIHYIPVYKHPFYIKEGYGKLSLPNTEDYYNKCISLPLFPSFGDHEFEFVVSSIQSFFDGC